MEFVLSRHRPTPPRTRVLSLGSVRASPRVLGTVLLAGVLAVITAGCVSQQPDRGASPTAGAGSGDTSDALEVAPAPQPFAGAWGGEPAAEQGGALRVAGTAPGPGDVRIQWKSPEGWLTVAEVKAGEDASWSATVTLPERAAFHTYRAQLLTEGEVTGSVALPEVDVYREHTYELSTRGEVATNRDSFARTAQAILDDDRGWLRAHHRFTPVTEDADFDLVLAQPETLPTFSRGCSVEYSCRAGRYVVINDANWRETTSAFVGDLATYRTMVLNHEVGHWLGLGHLFCEEEGEPAPLMQQQSKGMQGCVANGWPTAPEVEAVR